MIFSNSILMQKNKTQVPCELQSNVIKIYKKKDEDKLYIILCCVYFMMLKFICFNLSGC